MLKDISLNAVYIIFLYSGTVALCSLLTGSVISRFYDPALAPLVMGNSNSGNGTLLADNQSTPLIIDDETMKIELPNHAKIAIAASLCLLVGVIQVCCASKCLYCSTEKFFKTCASIL